MVVLNAVLLPLFVNLKARNARLTYTSSTDSIGRFVKRNFFTFPQFAFPLLLQICHYKHK